MCQCSKARRGLLILSHTWLDRTETTKPSWLTVLPTATRISWLSHSHKVSQLEEESSLHLWIQLPRRKPQRCNSLNRSNVHRCDQFADTSDTWLVDKYTDGWQTNTTLFSSQKHAFIRKKSARITASIFSNHMRRDAMRTGLFLIGKQQTLDYNSQIFPKFTLRWPISHQSMHVLIPKLFCGTPSCLLY